MDVFKHCIGPTLRDVRPINSAPRHTEPKQRELKKSFDEKLLLINAIEPAQAQLALLIVFAAMEDESQGFCVENRGFNALTIEDPYPIGLLDECVDILGEAHMFSTVKPNYEYWEIVLSSRTRAKKRLQPDL